jgi:hypothetical protein
MSRIVIVTLIYHRHKPIDLTKWILCLQFLYRGRLVSRNLDHHLEVLISNLLHVIYRLLNLGFFCYLSRLRTFPSKSLKVYHLQCPLVIRGLQFIEHRYLTLKLCIPPPRNRHTHNQVWTVWHLALTLSTFLQVFVSLAHTDNNFLHFSNPFPFWSLCVLYSSIISPCFEPVFPVQSLYCRVITLWSSYEAQESRQRIGLDWTGLDESYAPILHLLRYEIPTLISSPDLNNMCIYLGRRQSNMRGKKTQPLPISILNNSPGSSECRHNLHRGTNIRWANVNKNINLTFGTSVRLYNVYGISV